MGGARSMHGKDKKCIQNFGRIPERKRPLERRRLRWEDNITMDLRKTGWEVADWIHLVQDEDQWRNTVNLLAP